MADVTNRAAENGSIIIADTTKRDFSPTRPLVALRVLETVVIGAIESSNTVNIAWYVGRTVTPEDPVIIANITSITLSTAGAIQGVYT